MAHHRQILHQPGADPQIPLDSPPATGPGGQLPREQLERLAELVAVGEAPLGPGLSPEDHQELERRVRQLRRDRLVQLIARQIALDLHATRRAGDLDHDQA